MYKDARSHEPHSYPLKALSIFFHQKMGRNSEQSPILTNSMRTLKS